MAEKKSYFEQYIGEATASLIVANKDLVTDLPTALYYVKIVRQLGRHMQEGAKEMNRMGREANHGK